jgi:peroxiredoxin
MKKSQNDMRHVPFRRKSGLASLASALILLTTAAGGLTACKGGSEGGDKTPPGSAAPAPQPSAQAAPQPTPTEAAPAAQPPGPANPPVTAPPAPSRPAAVPEPTAGKMDFSLPLQAISNPLSAFSSYQGKKVLLFYFGPTCPHCQQALPQVQAFADEIRARGVETLAIANQRSNPEEIRGFIANYRARIPVFWDAERKFGEAYDVKTLPTIYLVGTGGDTFRLDNFSGKASLDSLRARL